MSRQSVDRGRCLCADRSPAVTSTEPGQHTRCQAARPEQIVLVNNLGRQGHPLRNRRRVCFHKALNIYLFYMNLFISSYFSSVFPKRVISDRWFLTRHQPSSVSSYPVWCASFILGGSVGICSGVDSVSFPDPGSIVSRIGRHGLTEKLVHNSHANSRFHCDIYCWSCYYCCLQCYFASFDVYNGKEESLFCIYSWNHCLHYKF